MWDRIKAFFKDSEVLFWARFQMIAGAAWLAVSQADLSPIIRNPKYFAIWVILNGFITEYLRRRRATDL